MPLEEAQDLQSRSDWHFIHFYMEEKKVSGIFKNCPGDLISLAWTQSVLRSCAAVVIWQEEYYFWSKETLSLERMDHKTLNKSSNLSFPHQ